MSIYTVHPRMRTVAAIATAFCIATSLLGGTAARAEKSELRIAYQTGLVYLPIMIMEHERLVEKHAARLGAADLKVTYPKISGAGPMNDALLSGSIDIAAGGVGGALTLWAKTRDTSNPVLAIAGFAAANMFLNTRNPKVRKLEDFSAEDRIAVPAVRVSTQALVLQMAAAQKFGEANYAKLDALTVSMPNPASAAALLSGSGGITSNFTAPPFSNEQLRKPEIHTVITSYEVMGNGTILDVYWATSQFRKENPKAFAAFLAAAKEGAEIATADKAKAARIYRELSGSKMGEAELLEILNRKTNGALDLDYTVHPRNITKWSDFLHKVGRLSAKPASWKELFFSDAHDLDGS